MEEVTAAKRKRSRDCSAAGRPAKKPKVDALEAAGTAPSAPAALVDTPTHGPAMQVAHTARDEQLLGLIGAWIRANVREEYVELADLLAGVNSERPSHSCEVTSSELERVLKRLQDEGNGFYAEGTYYLC
eukprot:NODE_11860_length_456_cov_8.799392_g11837_i0.p1 GENE.NODE_11860_length_456_cov_8.799392_g11837_i0~~NODE_11860_length_456_cov_8.799392_g11837_i0.p1  ORF type:complete len:139 (-),score=29.03 NODE_11860_length_456_cov_8.799392_g11837_i0:39-428(-)